MPPSNNETNSIKQTVESFLRVNNSYLSLNIKTLEIIEDLKNDISKVKYLILFNNKKINILGDGKGMVDALFRSLISELSENYPSLKQIRLSGFFVSAKIKSSNGSIGSESPVKVELVIKTNAREKIHFFHEANSLNNATTNAVIKAVEYFINCEIAILKLHKCIKDAKKRNRNDLIKKYTFIMSEIVKNMSYKNILTPHSK